jgi:hypothetical protein
MHTALVLLGVGTADADAPAPKRTKSALRTVPAPRPIPARMLRAQRMAARAAPGTSGSGGDSRPELAPPPSAGPCHHARGRRSPGGVDGGVAVRSRVRRRCAGAACEGLRHGQRGNGRTCGAPAGTARCDAVGFAASIRRHAVACMASTSAGGRRGEEGVPLREHRRHERAACRRSLRRCRPRRRRHQAEARRGSGHRRHRLRLVRERRSACVCAPLEMGARRDRGGRGRRGRSNG